MADYIAVAKTTAVPPSQIKAFEVQGHALLIANWQGTYFATQDLCTHDGGNLGEGELVDGAIECPRHGARFDLKTGRPTLPAMFPIKTFPVKVEGDVLLVALA